MDRLRDIAREPSSRVVVDEDPAGQGWTTVDLSTIQRAAFPGPERGPTVGWGWPVPALAPASPPGGVGGRAAIPLPVQQRGDTPERRIPAGDLIFVGKRRRKEPRGSVAKALASPRLAIASADGGSLRRLLILLLTAVTLANLGLARWKESRVIVVPETASDRSVIT